MSKGCIATCEWEHIEDLDGFYETSCNNIFKKITSQVFTGEKYENIKFIFCPCCGGKIKK